ncbi:unnamed protein product, partial [marine sediment metagenome]
MAFDGFPIDNQVLASLNNIDLSPGMNGRTRSMSAQDFSCIPNPLYIIYGQMGDSRKALEILEQMVERDPLYRPA